jgi:hypothetical protein
MNRAGTPNVPAINIFVEESSAVSSVRDRFRVTRNHITRKTAPNHFIETPSSETGDRGAVDLASIAASRLALPGRPAGARDAKVLLE